MKKINYDFKNTDLLNLALTQSGANATQNNERLEFLGDSVLSIIVSEHLYKNFKKIKKKCP